MYVMVFCIFSGCKKETIEPEEEGHWKSYTLQEMGMGNTASLHTSRIWIDANDNVYVYEHYGSPHICYLPKDGSTWSSQVLSTGVFYETIYDMEADEDGTMWVLGNARVLEMKEGEILNSFQVLGEDTAGIFNHFIDLERSSNGLWMTHVDQGLFELNTSTGVIIHHPDTFGYGDKDYLKATTDPWGGLWVPRNDTGFAMLRFDVLEQTWQNSSPLGYFGLGEENNYWFGSVEMNHHGIMYLLQLDGSTPHAIYILNTKPDGGYAFATHAAQDYFDADHDYQQLALDRYGIIYMYKSESQRSLISKFLNGYWETPVDVSKVFVGNVNINHVAFDSKNNMWLATSKGVAVNSESGF